MGHIYVRLSDLTPITILICDPQAEPGTLGGKLNFRFETLNFGIKFKFSTRFRSSVSAEIFIAIDRQDFRYVTVKDSAKSVQPF